MTTRFPLTRYALARFFVLLAMRVLPEEAEWPRDRLYWVNDSLKMSLGRMKEPGQ
ncbi:hypothetical protein [Aurantimonas coralicida]|uniref:hypothetical protein n=1 Tax=Aurantimonas coralicida TaxID=182270 RepID=UPI001E44C520|nr:hypothetical protein [Aurantimonas coralicida]MCD1645303.1 hypothetical protein [Aurantimonas coralicida]